MKKKKEGLFKFKVLAFLAILISLVALAYSLSPKIQEALPNILALPELSTLGFKEVSVNIDLETRSVVLRSDCYEIRAFVDETQAQSIYNGINNIKGPRPNSHDLIVDVFSLLDVKVLMVKIVDLRNNTFFGKLILKQGNKVLSLDSRPSDAVAIAARTEYLVPIYVKEELLKSVGRKVC